MADKYLKTSNDLKSDLMGLFNIQEIEIEPVAANDVTKSGNVTSQETDGSYKIIDEEPVDTKDINKEITNLTQLLTYSGINAGQLYKSVKTLINLGSKGGVSDEKYKRLLKVSEYLGEVGPDFVITERDSSWGTIHRMVEELNTVS